MSGIDVFRPEDAGGVAELFMRAFHNEDRPPIDRVRDYLCHVHFENPSYDPERGCIVHRNGNNRVDGFLAGYPFRLRCHGEPLEGAIVGTYMVDPETKDPFAAVRLVRAFLDRRPGVVLSDTANELARRIWSGMGVRTDPLLSMGWVRPLRPLRFSLSYLSKNRRPSRWLTGPLGLLARLPDAGAAALDERFFAADVRGLHTRELTETAMAELAPRVWKGRALVPDYDAAHLAWLFSELAAKRRYGPLRKREVLSDGEPVGWYLYYPNAGGVGQVVQMAASPDQYRRVLEQLMCDARSQGSLGLLGKVDPRHTQELTACGCALFQRSTWTFVQAHDPEAREALMRHDVMLSRLEGDWWTRLSGNDLSYDR